MFEKQEISNSSFDFSTTIQQPYGNGPIRRHVGWFPRDGIFGCIEYRFGHFLF